MNKDISFEAEKFFYCEDWDDISGCVNVSAHYCTIAAVVLLDIVFNVV